MDFDGARMRYLRAGSGPALILLHGLLGYSFSWRYTMPALAPYATVYAPDMLGPDSPTARLTSITPCRATARRLLCFVEQLGIASFDLLGTSHGGAVAMMAAAECADGSSCTRLRSLVLVAPVNPYSNHGQWLAPFLGSSSVRVLFHIRWRRCASCFPYFHARLYADRSRIPPDALAGYMAPLAKPGLIEHALSIVRTWTRDLRELEAVLPKLAGVRTLLVWGSKDPAVYVSSAKPLAKYFLDSQQVIFRGIGHMPYEECPNEFNRMLIEFLTGASSAQR